MSFDTRLGEHLRNVRQQKGLSLLDVEAASRKEFKASVLGAYERGERAISVRRLSRLAELYQVPAEALLPRDGSAEPIADEGIAVDLGRVQKVDTAEGRALRRYVQALQSERADWGGRMLTLRRDDLRALACALGQAPSDLVRRFDELGVLQRR